MLDATFIRTIVYLDLPLEAPGGPNRPQRLYVTAKHGSKLAPVEPESSRRSSKLLHSIRKGAGMLQEQVWGLKSL